MIYANGRKGMLYRGKGCRIVNIPAVYVNTNIGAKSIVAFNGNLLYRHNVRTIMGEISVNINNGQ